MFFPRLDVLRRALRNSEVSLHNIGQDFARDVQDFRTQQKKLQETLQSLSQYANAEEMSAKLETSANFDPNIPEPPLVMTPSVVDRRVSLFRLQHSPCLFMYLFFYVWSGIRLCALLGMVALSRPTQMSQ